jgi:hypothetical protein
MMIMGQSMSRDEFIAYAYEVIFGEGAECLMERIAEARNEIAMFGDAGPGALHRLRQDVADYNRIGETLQRLTGENFRRISLPMSR